MNRSRGAAWLALALGLAAVGGTAQAAVIYSSAPGVTGSGGGWGEIPLTSGSGAIVYLSPGLTEYYEDFEGNPQTNYMFPSWASLYVLSGATRQASLNEVIGSSTSGWNSETYLNNGTSYVGISFDNGGTTNYGWVQVTASGLGNYDSYLSFTVNAYAYDNTGASIKAGATTAAPAGGGTSAVPEASTSLGLLALGAGGLLTRRRLKRKA
ncbi:MAG: hypothetical protein RLZZ214_1193 [Verrucomicrobiota bacterium]